jgi:hypothetical protein
MWSPRPGAPLADEQIIMKRLHVCLPDDVLAKRLVSDSRPFAAETAVSVQCTPTEPAEVADAHAAAPRSPKPSGKPAGIPIQLSTSCC